MRQLYQFDIADIRNTFYNKYMNIGNSINEVNLFYSIFDSIYKILIEETLLNKTDYLEYCTIVYEANIKTIVSKFIDLIVEKGMYNVINMDNKNSIFSQLEIIMMEFIWNLYFYLNSYKVTEYLKPELNTIYKEYIILSIENQTQV